MYVPESREHKDETAVDSAISSTDDEAPAAPLTFKKSENYFYWQSRRRKSSKQSDHAHVEEEDVEIGEDGAKVIRGFNTPHTQRTDRTHPERNQHKSETPVSMQKHLKSMHMTTPHTAFEGRHGPVDGTYIPDPYRRPQKKSQAGQ